MEKYCRAGQTRKLIWRMCIACWITKSTNTPSDYVIFIPFPIHQLLHERPSNFRHSTFSNTCLSNSPTGTLLQNAPHSSVTIHSPMLVCPSYCLILNHFILAHCSTVVQVRCNMFRPSAFLLFSSS